MALRFAEQPRRRDATGALPAPEHRQRPAARPRSPVIASARRVGSTQPCGRTVWRHSGTEARLGPTVVSGQPHEARRWRAPGSRAAGGWAGPGGGG
jgi:hypothetical protein